MGSNEAPPEGDEHQPHDLICTLVRLCQQSYDEWKSSQHLDQRRAAQDRNREALEQLWEALAPDLRLKARAWLRSGIAPDVETLALNMFTPIVYALPKLTIDPSRNVRNLLLTIAWRGMTDEYRQIYAVGSQRQPDEDANQAALTPGSHEARMWSDLTPPSNLHEEPVDPDSFDAEDRMLIKIDQQKYIQVVWRFWQRTLSERDYQIMLLRWQSDPEYSFRDIALRLGPGWEEATVRQRHHRVMKTTLKYLREKGLVDDRVAS